MGLSLEQQLIRIGVAFLIGGLIGLERTIAQKPAGIRTHAILCIVCTMLTMTSAYGFDQFTSVNKDPARLIANILTGVGFVAGGVIYSVTRNGEKDVKGLTTAAGIWGAACLGVPIGLGHFALAVMTFITIELALKSEQFLEKLKLIPKRDYQEWKESNQHNNHTHR